jgi:hypothetical protein
MDYVLGVATAEELRSAKSVPTPPRTAVTQAALPVRPPKREIREAEARARSCRISLELLPWRTRPQRKADGGGAESSTTASSDARVRKAHGSHALDDAQQATARQLVDVQSVVRRRAPSAAPRAATRTRGGQSLAHEPQAPPRGPSRPASAARGLLASPSRCVGRLKSDGLAVGQASPPAPRRPEGPRLDLVRHQTHKSPFDPHRPVNEP